MRAVGRSSGAGPARAGRGGGGDAAVVGSVGTRAGRPGRRVGPAVRLLRCPARVLPWVDRALVEQLAGGNPTWNTGVDYRARLAGSAQRELVARAYRPAWTWTPIWRRSRQRRGSRPTRWQWVTRRVTAQLRRDHRVHPHRRRRPYRWTGGRPPSRSGHTPRRTTVDPVPFENSVLATRPAHTR